MNVQGFFELATKEINSFVDAVNKREYVIVRCEELFDEFIEPIDLPGPDAVVDPLLRSAIGLVVGRIYDEILRKLEK